MRAEGIWRASGTGCQWITALTSRTPRFSKIAVLTHASNIKSARGFCVHSESQHTRNWRNCYQARKRLPALVSTSPALTGAAQIALSSNTVRWHTTSTMATSTPDTTQQWTAQKVRDTFIKFFEERGHVHGKIDLRQLVATKY